MRRDKRRVSRRAFLKATAIVSLGSIAAGSSADTASAQQPAPTPPHGAELRGLNLPAKDPLAEGRFGFMFKGQPAAPADETLLTNLGQKMQETPLAPPASFEQNDAPNENPNAALTSGFTFVGQFVDHDITFDTTPLDLA